MTYPASKTTFTDPSASDPRNSPSHSALHTSINDTVEALQDTVGTTAGTSIAKNFAAGDFAARINGSNVLQQAISGTITGQSVNGGTIGGGVYGTALHQGGTLAGFAVNTTTITGGTITGQVVLSGTIGGGAIGTALHIGGTLTTPVINGGTYGTINAPASSDLLLVPASGSVILGSFKRQGGTSNDYSIGGTSNFSETSVFMQFGAGIIGTASGANSTVITYPVAFSQDPILITTANDETDTGDVLFTFVRGVSTTTGTVFSNGAVSGSGLTFNWIAIGKR